MFWVAVIPAALCVLLLMFGVQEPERPAGAPRTQPISRENLRKLSGAYWWVVGIGAVFTLARFSEAFLVLRVQQGGLAIAWVPMVLIVMNAIYALGAYPFGRLADTMDRRSLLAMGVVVLIGADALLAWSGQGLVAWGGIALWGVHMAMTQGLLAAMVADTSPPELRGTAFGLFNLVSGVAMLIASGLAGLLWDQLGAGATFGAGMGLASLSLLVLCCGRRLRLRRIALNQQMPHAGGRHRWSFGLLAVHSAAKGRNTEMHNIRSLIATALSPFLLAAPNAGCMAPVQAVNAIETVRRAARPRQRHRRAAGTHQGTAGQGRPAGRLLLRPGQLRRMD